jgi:peroxiredoxin
LEQHKEEIEAAGLRVVAVGLGEPKHARRYCPQLAPSVTCLCNSDAEAHRSYGLKRGNVLQLAGPQVIASALRAVQKGHSQGEATGDVTMLSATFVVDWRGIIQYAYYNKFAGDHPDLTGLLEAAQLIGE